MKIISKFKDFYDYLAQDYDADIIYVRNAKLVSKNRIRSEFIGGWRDNINGKILSYNTHNNPIPGDICLINYIFGVYPFIYSCPVIAILVNLNGDPSLKEWVISYPGTSFIEKFKDVSEKEENQLLEEYSLDILKTCKVNVDIPSKLNNNIGYWETSKWIKEATPAYYNFIGAARKIERPDIFTNLKSPVFLLINSDKPKIKNIEEKLTGLGLDYYKDIVMNHKNYLVDLSFTYIEPGLIKYWYSDLCDLGTYNYIENFLWSIKQEPISEPSDKQKIINHGFDTKTSFRKM